MINIAGLGIDICKVQRIAGILQKPCRDRFLNRVLHTNELKDRKVTAEYVAGRWAAKEALVKATGNRLLSFANLEIRYSHNGQPVFKIYPPNTEYLKQLNFFLSISHEAEYTVAVVISQVDSNTNSL